MTPGRSRQRARNRQEAGIGITQLSSKAATTVLEDEGGDSGPQRRCIATGQIHDRSILLRFVVSPEGELVPDVASRLPGRGLWLTPRRDILESALAKRSVARAARRSVSMAPGLAARVEALLVRRCCDALGLARRSGLAVAGFEK